MFKKMADRADRKAWADLEARLSAGVADEDRLDRLVVVQAYGSPPTQFADDGYLYFTREHVHFAPRKKRDVFSFPLQRLVGFEWSPEFGLLTLHIATDGPPGTGVALGFKPHMTPWPLVEAALQHLAAASEACPPLPDHQLWPMD